MSSSSSPSHKTWKRVSLAALVFVTSLFATIPIRTVTGLLENNAKNSSTIGSTKNVTHLNVVKRSAYYGFDHHRLAAAAPYPFVQDNMMSSSAHSRGSHSHGHGHGWDDEEVYHHHMPYHHHKHNDHNDLYSLLAGLGFAGILGATIVALATRNTSGRRKRSVDSDSIFDDEDDNFGKHSTPFILDAVSESKF